MKLIKIIIDHTNNKVFGQSVSGINEKGKDILSIHDYKGFADCTGAKKVVDNKSITIYDLRI